MQRTSDYHQRVLLVSRLVWDHVVPWLLPPALLVPRKSASAAILRRSDCLALVSVGEGVFPLVPRVCRLIIAHSHKYLSALDAAAQSGAKSCLRWLSSVAWLLRANHTNTEAGEIRRAQKEFIVVLRGLCCGGHLEMAKRLVDGCDCDGNWPVGISWPVSEIRGLAGGSDLRDYVRACDVLTSVCRHGQLEVLWWMVDRFDIREPWEFVVPLVGAASGGHIEVMQWIVDTYPDVVPAIRKHEAWVEIHKGACKSGDLAVITWCSVTFPMPYSFGWFLRYFDWTPADSAEVRQYLNDHSPPPADYTPGSIFFGSVYTVERLKWVGSERLGVVFNEDDLQYICQVSKWNDVAKWVVEEHHVRPTPATFSSACTNYHGNVQLVQWLAPQVHLSYEDLFACFIDSLANNQLEIASWLNNSFHILSQAVSTPDSILARVCRKRVHGEKVEAVKWLLDHTALAKVEETLWIEDSVLELLFERHLSKTPFFIMKKFHTIIKEPKRSELLVAVLKEIVKSGTLTQVKKIIAMGKITRTAAAGCLVNPDCICFSSTKSVKWLITHFQLDRECISLDLVFSFMLHAQASCAEWLIDRFQITLDEVLRMKWKTQCVTKLDLHTWQMMLRVFPRITTRTIKQHFMSVVCQTPVMAEYTMRLFPDITAADCAAWLSRKEPWLVPLSLRCWFGAAFPPLNKNLLWVPPRW